MTRPLAENGGDQHSQPNRGRFPDPARHIIDPAYDNLFLTSWTPTCNVVEAVFGDHAVAVEIAETALMNAGLSWLYIPHSTEFVKALAMVFALRHLAEHDRIAHWNTVRQQRRQGRLLSSVNDASFDSTRWLKSRLAGLHTRQLRVFDVTVCPLTREDLASLLDANTHEVPRLTARLRGTRAPKEEQ